MLRLVFLTPPKAPKTIIVFIILHRSRKCCSFQASGLFRFSLLAKIKGCSGQLSMRRWIFLYKCKLNSLYACQLSTSPVCPLCFYTQTYATTRAQHLATKIRCVHVYFFFFRYCILYYPVRLACSAG